MPCADSLGDHTRRHFAEGVALQAPPQGSPGDKKELGGAGVTDPHRWRGDEAWTRLRNLKYKIQEHVMSRKEQGL